MKNLIKTSLLALGILVAIVAHAQDFSAQAREQVSKFAFMIGEWEGDSWYYTQQGQREESTVYEDIQFELGQTIVKMRGIGRSLDSEARLVHDALGVLYYDGFQQKFRMDSWIGRGMHTSANVEYKGEGNFVWWFEAGPAMTMRYTVTIKEDTWNEIGEMSQDGSNWRQFFEMNLTRK